MRALGLFDPEPAGPSGHLLARWLWLRALGVIFFSAFFSLAFQAIGLIGPRGILPAQELLDWYRTHEPGLARFWEVPTLLWLSGGRGALWALVAVGMAASVALVANLAPRLALAVATLGFLSFVAAARDFSGYESDGMLLEAGVLSLFLAPPGWRPRLGAAHPPMRAARLMLLWQWFRIYFCSGIVKLSSHDPEWRSLTALDHYYQNGPLPTWIGYYVAQLPHGFHAACALFILVLELGLVLLVLVPVRRVRLALFLVVSALQIVIILTANYAFLNYFVLALGILLVDDRALARGAHASRPGAEPAPAPTRRARIRHVAASVALGWLFYATLLELPHVPSDALPW